MPPAVTESASFALRVVAPVGLTFAASVAFSNLAAAEISVPLAQMLKGMNPLIILVITAAAGLSATSHTHWRDQPALPLQLSHRATITHAGLEPISAALVTVVVLLSVGVVLTATGELRFSVIGSASGRGGARRGAERCGRRASLCYSRRHGRLPQTVTCFYSSFAVVFQTVSCFSEAARMVLTQVLLQKHLAGASTLVSLHLYATVAFCALLPVAALLEPAGVGALLSSPTSAALAAGSSAVAFVLNIAAMRLVAITSGLTLTVAGQLKDA